MPRETLLIQPAQAFSEAGFRGLHREINLRLGRIAELLDARETKLTLRGALNAGDNRLTNVGTAESEDDAVPLRQLRAEVLTIVKNELDLRTSEGTEDGDTTGDDTSAGEDTDEGVVTALELALPTAPPPNVAAVSAIGTTDGSLGDQIRFSLQDHTHGGVLGAPPGGGIAGQIAFFTSTFEINGDTALVYDAATDVLNAAGQVVVGSLAAPSNASVGLEILSTTKALLLSRLTTAQKLALTALDGMVVFDDTLDLLQMREQSIWRTPLALEGRPGTTNDPIISSSGVVGTIYGSDLANASLALRGSFDPTTTENELVIARSRFSIAPLFGATQIGSTDFAFIDAGSAATYELADLATIQALIMQTGFNMDAGTVTGIRAMRGVQLRSLISSDAGGLHDLGVYRAFNNVVTYTPGAGATMANLLATSVGHGIIFSNTGTTNTATENFAVRMQGNIGASWTCDDWALGQLNVPITGTGVIARFGFGVMEDPASFVGTITDAFTLWMKGPSAYMAHAGAALFGADQTALTAPAASAGIELRSTTLAVLLSRMTTAQKTALTASDGMLVYDTTTTKINARENGAWVEFALAGAAPATHALLSASHSDTVAATVVRGDLVVGNATPAWARFALGATDKYLRSNGTDPAWADVTELGLVDTYNGVTLAGKGVPHIVASVDSTGNTANIALNALYAVPADGFYRVSAYVIITTVGTVTSTLPQVNVTWTDGDNAVGQSIVLTGGVGVTPTPPPGYASAATQSALANTTSTLRGGDFVCYVNGGTNIQYSTSGYAANAANSMVYSVHIRVEAL